MSETWTVRRVIEWMQSDLTRRGFDSPRLEADLLVCAALKQKRIALYLDLDRPLHPAELTEIRALLERRRKNEPMAYILGEREFYGRPFTVTPAVLIPRPDTETLVEQALAALARGPAGPLLDLCTGSGAVGLSLCAERPSLSAVLTDLSPEALAVARSNAERLKLADRVTLCEGDLFAAVAGDARFACITANPPYIGRDELALLAPDVRCFEPHLALDAGVDPLSFYRRIAGEAAGHLLADGALLVEVGIHQAAEVSALFADAGLVDIAVHRDLAGVERVVSARQASAG